MSYGFSLAVAGTPLRPPPPTPPSSSTISSFSSSSLSPSSLSSSSCLGHIVPTSICLTLELVSDLSVAGFYLLSIFSAFTTVPHIYQSSLLLIALSSL